MIGKLWPLLIGFSIWALAFMAIYALQALGCVWGWPDTLHRGALLTVWAVTMATLGLVLLWQRRLRGATNPATYSAGMALTLAAILASTLTYMPVLFASLCV